MNPPGIRPPAYVNSRYSTVSGKKSIPSFGSGDATAVARTTLSPLDVRAAPEACLAIRPVSNLICLPPASSTVTSCFMGAPLLFFLIDDGTCTRLRWSGARGEMQPGEAGIKPGRELHGQNL